MSPRSARSLRRSALPRGAADFVPVVTCVALAFVVGCKREQAKPDPERAVPSPASTVQDAAPTDTPRPIRTPVEERTPIVAREGETKTLSLVGLRPVEFALGQQRADSFSVFQLSEKGGAAKLVVAQGGFTFTQTKPGYQSPLTLETKTITGGPVAAAEEIRRLEGVWPDMLFARANFASFLGARQYTSSTGDFERAEGKWTKVKALADATAVVDDAVIAIEGGKLTAYRGNPKTLPLQAKPPADAGCANEATYLQPRALDARTGAGVVLVGEICPRGPFGVERFADGSGAGKVEPLPDAPENQPGKGATLRASIGSAEHAAVWISGSVGEYLAVARGAGPFRKVALPVAGKIVSVIATPDAAVFALIRPEGRGPEVLFRLVDAMWTRFELPADVGRVGSVGSFFAADRETAIVGGSLAGGEGTRAAALFATFPSTLHGKPAEVKALLQLEKVKADLPPAASSSAAPAEATPPFPPYEEGCVTPFVYVFDVSKSAPADFTFPATKRALASFGALKQIKLVEVTHRGKRRLGAHVPDAATGRALVAHVIANMKDESPLLVCFAPTAEREIAVP